MPEKIECEKCSRMITRSCMKRHVNSKACIKAQHNNEDFEEQAKHLNTCLNATDDDFLKRLVKQEMDMIKQMKKEGYY